MLITRSYHYHLQSGAALVIFVLHAFTIDSFQPTGLPRAVSTSDRPREILRLYASANDDDPRGGGGEPDLTDRFKYKVHALMGTYDPPSGTVDDENQTGNIIGAMLQFPTEYTFSVVGKTSDGDSYSRDVKSRLESILGSNATMETRVVPRGTKFTRVSVKVNVDSAAMISSIYEELDTMELTVMKF